MLEKMNDAEDREPVKLTMGSDRDTLSTFVSGGTLKIAVWTFLDVYMVRRELYSTINGFPGNPAP